MTAQTEHRLKIALWCVPLVFSAGSLWAVATVNNADVSDRVEQVEEGLKIHSALKAHPVSESRLDVLVTEQRAIRTEQSAQASNISAICQATGARCK
jgi:hypothetical protein